MTDRPATIGAIDKPTSTPRGSLWPTTGAERAQELGQGHADLEAVELVIEGGIDTAENVVVMFATPDKPDGVALTKLWTSNYTFGSDATYQGKALPPPS